MKTYSVGGSVRDELLGRPVKDRDFVVVGATPEQMIADGFRPVGRDFPVFLHPDTQEEYALARTERKTAPGYHGFVFHATPEVTLEQDLARRDLTINAIARDGDGRLIDPFRGQDDLRAGILRHVGPAFAEDPLRVLRVARFAARFGFSVAPETEGIMRAIVRSGELATLTTERTWQELSRAMMEGVPSRFFAVLRRCGALAAILPEVDALFGVPQPVAHHPELDAGVHVMEALDFAAHAGDSLAVRYAVLTHDLGKAVTSARALPRHVAHEAMGHSLVEALSERLRVPVECRQLARLVARHHSVVHRAEELRPAGLLDLLVAADAFRRPQRLEGLIAACAADAQSRPGWSALVYRPAHLLHEALEVARSVDAGALASSLTDASKIPARLRVERIAKLEQWKRRRMTAAPPPD